MSTNIIDGFADCEGAMRQMVFVEDGIMFGGMYEAKLVESDNPFWQVRKLPDRPDGKAEVIAQRKTRSEAFDKLFELVYGDGEETL
jgi:hypothetical protein